MEKVEVYFDGQCGFCQAMSARLTKLDRHHRLVMRDYNDPDIAKTAAPRFTPADLAREMHVRLPDGTWRIGFAGWAAILRVLPGTSWLGAVLQFPPVAEIGRGLYRWFAPRRRVFSRILGLPAPCGSDGACRIPQAAQKPPVKT